MMRFKDVRSALDEIKNQRERIQRMENPPNCYQEQDKHLARLEEAYEKELIKAAERNQEDPTEWWAQKVYSKY